MTITFDPAIPVASNTVFAEDPIIVKAVMGTGTADIPEGATLAQLVLRIVTNGSHVHKIAQQFTPGDTLYFNISSALQAEVQLQDRQNEPKPNLAYHWYGAFPVSVLAYVRYLLNGEEWDGEKHGQMHHIIEGDFIYALRGGLQPQFRQTIATSPSAAVTAFASNLSTKPHISVSSVLSVANPSQHPSSAPLYEIKKVGDTQLQTSLGGVSGHAASTNPTTVQAGDVTQQFIAESNPNRHQIIFRNSLGATETFSVLSLTKKTYSVSSEEFAILSNPTYNPSLNLLTQAQNPSQKWEMSTGFVPSAWAEWFMREVLTATYVWMEVPILNPITGETATVTLPVHLEVDDVTLQNKAQAQLQEVKFDVIIPPVA